MKVLVTGGAGYIGSHVILALMEAGYQASIADNFSNSKPSVVHRLAELCGSEIPCYEVDLTSQAATDQVFAHGGFDAVVHCAGYKAVAESAARPIEYYRNNLDSTLAIVEAMREHNVQRMVFSSSATVYGSGLVPPFREDHGPLESTNPYGQTKVMIERILGDVARASDGWRVALLRYFNPVGAHESGLIGEDPRDVPNNLMPYIAQVAVGGLPRLTIHGDDYDTPDGTGERDYVHVLDLAAGHVAALAHLDTMDTPVRAFNLGTGTATSVRQLVNAFENASGRRIPIRVGPRRPGDLATAYASPSRAEQELGWKAMRSVQQMCEDSWRWQSTHSQESRTDLSVASVIETMTTPTSMHSGERRTR